MAQNGCIPNEVRGGGCYWGPDVTEEVLGRHNLQLLIRSHECKQEGYEFCHNRMVSAETHSLAKGLAKDDDGKRLRGGGPASVEAF